MAPLAEAAARIAPAAPSAFDVPICNVGFWAATAFTCLQLGNLNTDDALSVPVEEAAARGDGGLVPIRDVVAVVRTLLHVSDAAFVRERVMPAIADERF
ncbi:hypothetical protein LMG29660_00161 [Burkholderia puraquae]|uniref:Uncharacterized protein n=2 Tax=Burkholderia puraquae TaxID=1904757 RepID=A0A6J5CWH3_9BURK|nr:hypothetical protein LMG29660_00161 [Burkholderia puraquae]